MAVQDVSADFARQMKGEHLSDLDTDKLIAFRIFRVDSQFIHDLRAEGLNISDSDKLVAFRIHGVTPEMVRALHQAGYSPGRRHVNCHAHPWRDSGMDAADEAARL